MATTYNAGYTDAQSVNESSRTTFLYKDFSLFFTLNPVTADVTTLTDVQDIKRSVRNLVMTNKWDRLFHPEIASGVRESLFEPFGPVTVSNIRDKVKNILENYEPRVKVLSVDVNDPTGLNQDNNKLNIQINFALLNEPNMVQEVDVMLERVR
ncbi:MAG TPA: hypothetical protein EYM50_01545 [Nitrososphaerales archaeon]|jgi:phage baseplate assembly protein W|nr:hypothetical protein [Nitrososphaerales archaeon]